MMKSLLSKKIAVFGAGAVGCYFGYQFAEAGFDIEFIARGEQYNALKRNGLAVNGFDRGTFHSDVKVEPELKGLYDIILICVKSKDTVTAAAQVASHLKPDGLAVSLQNGIENSWQIASIIGEDKVISTAIYLTVMLERYGYLKYMSRGKILFDAYSDSGKSKADTFEAVLGCTKILYKREHNIEDAQWRKLMLNISMNPLSALFGYNFGQMVSNTHAMRLAKKLFDEAKIVAISQGVFIKDNEFDSIIEQCRLHPDFKTSMLQDIELNRQPEIDAMLGVIARLGGEAGLALPNVEMMLKIFEVKYGGWFHTAPRLAADVLILDGSRVLLIERQNPPHGWAIPGGFVNMYERIEEAAVRELYEETGVQVSVGSLELLGIYSAPERDPRGHTASAVYVWKGYAEAHGSDDAKDAQYFEIGNLPAHIAFDHRKVIMDCIQKYNLEKYL